MKEKIILFRTKLSNLKLANKTIFIITSILFSLYVFVFCSFGSRPKLYLLSYPVLALLLIAAAFYAFVNFENIRKRFSWPLLLPMSFVCIVFLTTLFGTRDFTYFKTIFLLTMTCYLSFVCYICFNNLKLVLYLICVPVFAFTIYYFVHYFPQLIKYSGQRLGSFFGNENDVGLNLYFGFVLATILSFAFKQYWMTPTAILMLIASITTGSKKVIILSFFFLIFFTFILLKKHKVFLIIALALILLLSILFFSLPVFADIKKRFINGLLIFGGNDVDASSINRLLFFKSSLYLGTKSFFLGYGGSGFAKLSGFNVYSHNNIGEVLCDFGVFGIFSFYLLYPITCFLTNKKDNVSTLINFSFTGTFVFCTFTAVFFDTKIYYVLLALVLFINSNNQLILKKDCSNRRSYYLLEI